MKNRRHADRSKPTHATESMETSHIRQEIDDLAERTCALRGYL
jgi:hypothetical protein